MIQVLPLFFPVTYRFILPAFSALASAQSYQALSSDPEVSTAPENSVTAPPAHSGKTIYLTTKEKLALIRPLVLRYMLPLCAVYIEEYIINSVSLFRFSRGTC
jgi:battenin